MSNKLKKVLLGTAVIGAVIAGIAYLKKAGKKCCCHSNEDSDDMDNAEEEEFFDEEDAFSEYDAAERTYVEITPVKESTQEDTPANTL